MVDFPGGVVPITKVTEEDIKAMEQYPQHDAAHRKLTKVWNRQFKGDSLCHDCWELKDWIEGWCAYSNFGDNIA